MNGSTSILSASEDRLRAGLVKHTMYPNPAVEQTKTFNGPIESPWNQSGEEEPFREKGLPKSQVLR